MKLIKTINSTPQYIVFDSTTDNLICAYQKEKTDTPKIVEYFLKEYDIRSGAEIHGNFEIEDICPELFNKAWFDSQYYFDDHTYNGGALIIQKRINDNLDSNTKEQIYWNSSNEFPHGINNILQINRTDSRFPFLIFWDRKDIIVFDLEKKEIIKTIASKVATGEIYHQIYLSKTLDRIVCKKNSSHNTAPVPSLVFFATIEDFEKNTPQFTWTPSDKVSRYDAIGFLNSNIFVFSTSTFGRYTFTGETRLYIYDFNRNKIIVNLRLTSLFAINSSVFYLDHIAISNSEKYLAFFYNKKIYIYEL